MSAAATDLDAIKEAAREAGKWARRDDRDIEDNDYPDGSPEAAAWTKGHRRESLEQERVVLAYQLQKLDLLQEETARSRARIAELQAVVADVAVTS